MGWWDIPSAEETEIPKVSHQEHVDKFFRLTWRSAQRIRTRGKTVYAELYTGVMDRLLKRIQRVRPAAFCSRDIFLLHNNVPPHKAARIWQFLTPKNVTTIYHPPYSPDLSPPDYFLFPKLKIKLKGLHFADVAETQETITDELKKAQKRNFQQLFRNCTTAQKRVYMPMELILN